MDLGRMFAEALERHGFALPSGSGVAGRELSEAAEDFLNAVRTAEAGTTSEETEQAHVPADHKPAN